MAEVASESVCPLVIDIALLAAKATAPTVATDFLGVINFRNVIGNFFAVVHK